MASFVTVRHLDGLNEPGLPRRGRLAVVVVEWRGKLHVLGRSGMARDMRERAPRADGYGDLLHGMSYWWISGPWPYRLARFRRRRSDEMPRAQVRAIYEEDARRLAEWRRPRAPRP